MLTLQLPKGRDLKKLKMIFKLLSGKDERDLQGALLVSLQGLLRFFGGEG
jgi:hypothetical protein